MWVSEIFNHFKFKLLLFVAFILLISTLSFAYLWQKERAFTQMAQLDLTEARTEIVESLLDQERQIRELVATNNQISLDAEITLNKAHAVHKEQLREIQENSRHLADLNRGLRSDVETLNRELSTYTRATVESYATTAGNNLAECAATVEALERISLEYNSEIEFLRAAWPKPTPPHKQQDDP